MITIIPLAGHGQRFADAGYLLPKPLIPVSGEPMIAQAIKKLPPSDQWIFVVRQEHIDEYKIDEYLKRLVKNPLVVVDHEPKGQASSALCAIEHISDDEEILIAACDSSCLIDESKFKSLRRRSDIDMVLWTFTKDPLLSAKPEAWGYAKLADDEETIVDMSVKVPVSNNPENDHAVTATFYFRRAKDYKDSYQEMYDANHRINGEFYIDTMPIYLSKIGKKSVIFDVDQYVSWGKPADLYDYHIKEHQFNINPEKLSKNWRRFFVSTYISFGSSFASLKNEVPRFLIQGLSAVATDYLTYIFLISLIANSQAKMISFILGTGVAYILGKYWTFNHHPDKRHTLMPFIILYAITLTANVSVNTLVLNFLPGLIGPAFLIATGTSTILNFIGQKWFVFRTHQR